MLLTINFQLFSGLVGRKSFLSPHNCVIDSNRYFHAVIASVQITSTSYRNHLELFVQENSNNVPGVRPVLIEALLHLPDLSLREFTLDLPPILVTLLLESPYSYRICTTLIDSLLSLLFSLSPFSVGCHHGRHSTIGNPNSIVPCLLLLTFVWVLSGCYSACS